MTTTRFYLLFLCLLFSTCIGAQEYYSIPAKREAVIDTFFNNYSVCDNYRWMENTNSPELADWLEQENDLSVKFLRKSDGRINSFKSIERYNYKTFNYNHKQGKYYFYTAVDNGLKSHGIYIKKSLNEEKTLLVDPSYISGKDEIVIQKYKVSASSRYLAYFYNRNGSDWREAEIVQLPGGKRLKDHLTGIKYSSLVWKGDEGFYYIRVKQEGKFGRVNGQQVFYHKVETDQSDDQLIIEKENPNILFSLRVTSDNRFLVVSQFDRLIKKVTIYTIDFESTTPVLKVLVNDFSRGMAVLDSYHGQLLFKISRNNIGEIISINPDDPRNLTMVFPGLEKGQLVNVRAFSDRLFLVYHMDLKPVIFVADYSGKLLYRLDLPFGTAVTNISGGYGDESVLFHLGGYYMPPVEYSFNLHTFKRKVVQKANVNFIFSDIVTQKVNYKGKDGVLIPMILVYKKGLKQNGKTPTLLKTYGGFGLITNPSFDPGIVYWVKKGGLFAFADIRGGGDFGWKWAAAGRGIHKQTSVDDFIAASEFLIKTNYTNPDLLATEGASNGGFVVASAAMQRPDLYKVVVPISAPLDILRLEKFTVGHYNMDEFGSVKKEVMFKNMLHYSPYTIVTDSVNYPSMLLIANENDDRVPPFNSYKFAAAMQNRRVQTNPVLLKVYQNAGHYGQETVFQRLKNESTIYDFILSNFNLN